MDIDSGKLYSDDEVEKMTEEAKAKILWITRQEFNALINIPEKERPAKLREMRHKTKNTARKKRKQARASRKKNR